MSYLLHYLFYGDDLSSTTLMIFRDEKIPHQMGRDLYRGKEKNKQTAVEVYCSGMKIFYCLLR
jgi:hypothetical protein